MKTTLVHHLADLPAAAARFTHWLLPLLAALLVAAGAAPVRASPIGQFSPYAGSGNVSVFDAALGTGGWVGSIDGLVDPNTGLPMPLASVVLFQVDSASQTFTGTFELTGGFDLGSVLSGLVSGTVTAPDILDNGGQFAIDYIVQGGTGVFARQTGFGLSFLDFTPTASPDNYSEAGLFVLEPAAVVPTPAPALLLLSSLGLLAWMRRRTAAADGDSPGQESDA